MKIFPILKLLLVICISVLLTSCGQKKPGNTKQTISVSILPIKYIVEQIVENDFDINVLVPYAASPETYEPTTTQMIKIANSLIYVNIGLIDFENNLGKNIEKNNPYVRIINLNKGIAIIQGHTHEHNDADHSSHNHVGNNALDDMQGIDPHIWSSPKNLKQMAGTFYTSLMEVYPDSIKYRDNYNQLLARLDSLEVKITEIFTNAGAKKIFIIYHPALSYLARDYGLTQIAIEDEGKEPSANHIKTVMETAKINNIATLFYQRQFSKTTVDALSKELKIEAVEIDPLAENIIDNTLYMCRLIAK